MNKFIKTEQLNKAVVVWHKLNDAAKIPSKRDEDAGLDIYTIESNILLEPHETRLFATGLQAAVDKDWWLLVKDRGSTGSKGIHVHCGVIDSGYRGEIFICLHNGNDKPVFFYQDEQYKYADAINYPVSKAIAQIIVVPVPIISNIEVSDREWEDHYATNSKRGAGALGSSGN